MIGDKIRISVNDLIRYAYQQGDLKTSFVSPKRAQAGTRLHQRLQNSRGETYQREVTVSYQVQVEDPDLTIAVHGRIDGVFFKGDIPVIEEIKSTRLNLEAIEPDDNGYHFAQARIYAFIYADQLEVDHVEVHLTYGKSLTGDTRTFERKYALEELSDFFFETIDLYLKKTRELHFWQDTRDKTIRKMKFPFSAFRQGQDILIDEITGAAVSECNLFVQAPTGLGKTLATLFPAIQSLGKHTCSKIFYFTAKTTTRDAAELALDQLRSGGLRLKSITLTAKEKLCFIPGTVCEARHCRFLAGYYDRVTEAIHDIHFGDKYTRHTILDTAMKYQLCPFEFSLDLSLLCDCVICDYNYLFDPKVQLARYFVQIKHPFLFLVDEAHNLVDRSRDMFSANLTKREILDLQRLVKSPEAEDIFASLKALNNFLLKIRKSADTSGASFQVVKEVPGEFIELLEDFLGPTEAALSEEKSTPYREALKDFYYRAMFFMKIHKISEESEGYAIIFKIEGSNVTVKLNCLDASRMIAEATAKSVATVFFSATLSPEAYFFRLLGGRPNTDHAFQLPSPFPEENLCLNIVTNISTKYRDRQTSYDPISRYLSVFVSQKEGNYFVFFPSFQYLEEVHHRFVASTSEVRVLKQERAMTESDRDAFLANFTEKNTQSQVAFVVTGGIFGESIDLPGERLIGVAIIGVGLPQINKERDLIKRFFDGQSENGFHYAYTYPGMSRVLQAAGRLIRTDSDKGALLLIDDRFGGDLYQRLYPEHWRNPRWIRNPGQLKEVMTLFWDNTEEIS